MNKDIIILIPTKGRQNYLNRVASYYSKFDMHTYICDAYQTRCEVDTYDTIHYQWNPNLGFFEELLDVINKTNAGFYLLAPDDDFVKYESLLGCYNRMINDRHIALSTGKQAFFSENFDGTFLHHKFHNRICDQHISFLNALSTKLFWNNYQNIHWSLFSRECIIDALTKLDYARFNYACFAEFIFGVEALRHGGIFFYDDYFNFREDSSKPHWGTVAPSISWKNIILSSDLRSDISKLKFLYCKDALFVYKCLYSYLGNPFVLLFGKFYNKLKCNKKNRKVTKTVFYDEIMCKRIEEAFSKMG